MFVASRSLVLRVHGAAIRWVFEHAHDRRYTEHQLLPWALPDACLLPSEAAADFNVGVHLTDPTLISAFSAMPGFKFMLAGEIEDRYSSHAECISFVQDARPQDGPYVRYAPILCIWSPPVSVSKTKMCSVVDSGKRVERVQLIRQASQSMGAVDIYGKLGDRPLMGYHEMDGMGYNFKHHAIQEYGFYLAIERACALDYITEKFNDAIMAEAVPVYHGAPNLADYCIPEAVVPFANLEAVDWKHWRKEYDARQRFVRMQKEELRTKFNVLSYFSLLVHNMSWLDRLRPITLS